MSGLLDWLTEGIGSSAGQGETGMGAGGMAAMTPPDVPIQQTGADAPPLPPAMPMPAGGDPMTAGGVPDNGPGLPPNMPVPPTAIKDTPKTAFVPNAGPAASPPAATSPSGTGMPPGPPMSLAPSPPVPAGASWLGQKLGLDANKEKSFFGSLGAGLTAAGNSRGKSKGQALFSGAGGAIEGGVKAEDKSYDQRLKALTLAVAAQKAGDTAAYNKNYAEYLKGKLESDKEGMTPGSKRGAAWNKPDSQKFIDAQAALARDPEVHASQKMLEQLAKTGAPPDEIARASAAHKALIQQKQGMYLQGVGLDPQKIAANMENPPGTPRNPHVINSKQDFDTYVKPGQAYKNPADGQIYIRKTGDVKAEGADVPDQATPVQPPGPPPGYGSMASAEEPAEAGE